MKVSYYSVVNQPYCLEPILIDTGMKATKIKWNHSGSAFAIAGTQNNPQDKEESNTVQFYTPFGHVSSLIPKINVDK